MVKDKFAKIFRYKDTAAVQILKPTKIEFKGPDNIWNERRTSEFQRILESNNEQPTKSKFDQNLNLEFDLDGEFGRKIPGEIRQ